MPLPEALEEFEKLERIRKKEQRKQRQKESKKHRKKLTISFSPYKTNVSYSKFTTKELVAARSLLDLTIEHRTKGLALEPESPRSLNKKHRVTKASEELIKKYNGRRKR